MGVVGKVALSIRGRRTNPQLDAIWVPVKPVNVTRRGRTMSVPVELDEPPKRHASRDQVERVNPDVVIQFSWKNGDAYEEKVIDDFDESNTCGVQPSSGQQ